MTRIADGDSRDRRSDVPCPAFLRSSGQATSFRAWAKGPCGFDTPARESKNTAVTEPKPALTNIGEIRMSLRSVPR
jgi:hypothetical protein